MEKLSLSLNTFIENRLEEKGILRRGSCKGFPIEECSKFMRDHLGVDFVEEYLEVLLKPYPWDSISTRYDQKTTYMKGSLDAAFTQWIISIHEKSKLVA